jgi:hypothetical protein
MPTDKKLIHILINTKTYLHMHAIIIYILIMTVLKTDDKKAEEYSLKLNSPCLCPHRKITQTDHKKSAVYRVFLERITTTC